MKNKTILTWIINQGELWKYLIDDIELAKSIDDILQYKFCFWGQLLIVIIFFNPWQYNIVNLNHQDYITPLVYTIFTHLQV